MIPENYQVDPHKWVNLHADYLYAYAITRINDEEQAKDLVQETFLAALQKVDKFERKSSERTWLTSILKNKIVDIYRKNSSGLRNKGVHEAEEEQDDFFNAEDGHWNADRAPKVFGIDDYDPLLNKEFKSNITEMYAKIAGIMAIDFYNETY